MDLRQAAIGGFLLVVGGAILAHPDSTTTRLPLLLVGVASLGLTAGSLLIGTLGGDRPA